MSQSITLPSGQAMPTVGLGTWKADHEVVKAAVVAAIEAGYRHIDCACDYGNEKAVGEAIASCIERGLVKRTDLFVTSKLWNTFHAPEHVPLAIERTLSDLQLEYLDLYLIHFPIALKYVPIETRYPPEWFYDLSAPTPRMELADVPVSATWGAMESLVAAGKTKNIGVSNFNCQLLMDLMKIAKIKPAVNQVELHPFLTQEDLVRYCKHIGVVVTGFSPLGHASYVPLGMASESDNILAVPAVQEIAKKHGKTPAQVVLRWGAQRGYTIVPKSGNPERIKENISIFDFELSGEEMAALSALNRNRRFNDPSVFCERVFGCYYPIYG